MASFERWHEPASVGVAGSLITAANTCALEICNDDPVGGSLVSNECLILSIQGWSSEVRKDSMALFGLGKTLVKGLNPSVEIPFSLESDPFLAGHLHATTGWTTPPGIPTRFFTLLAGLGDIGNHYSWSARTGLVMKPGECIVIWNMIANPKAWFEIKCEASFSKVSP